MSTHIRTSTSGYNDYNYGRNSDVKGKNEAHVRVFSFRGDEDNGGTHFGDEFYTRTLSCVSHGL